ncbi:unnamed protein product, partial [Staurois parvus]
LITFWVFYFLLNKPRTENLIKKIFLVFVIKFCKF